MKSHVNDQHHSFKSGILHLFRRAALCLLMTLFASGMIACGSSGGSSAQTEAAEDVIGSRDSTPVILVPEQPGKDVLGNEEAKLDISNISEGYISAAYFGDAAKVKVQITADDHLTYTFDLRPDGSWNVFPLSTGDGHYVIGVYSNIEATMYAEVFSTELDVVLTDEF